MGLLGDGLNVETIVQNWISIPHLEHAKDQISYRVRRITMVETVPVVIASICPAAVGPARKLRIAHLVASMILPRSSR